MLRYKLIIAGAKDVGKTSLIQRFCENSFNEDTLPTLGAQFVRKKLKIKTDHEELETDMMVWDFGGEENYRSLFPKYANGASAAIILYDITRKDSLEDVNNWIHIIIQNAEPDVYIQLIGAKLDLEEERQITKEDALERYNGFSWCDDIIETSSKTGRNVELAFTRVAKEVIKIKLKACKSCGKHFAQKLLICPHCGESTVTFS